MSNAIINMSSRELITLKENSPTLLSPWDNRVAGGDFYLLCMQFFVFFIGFILLENIKHF